MFILNQNFKQSYNEGFETEELFVELCIKNGITVEKTPPNVDMFQHIDYYIYFNNKKTSVDVKNERRKSRHSSDDEEKVLWLELKNVHGKNGWLYGDANFIAIKYNYNKFIFVKRIELIELLNEKRLKHDNGSLIYGNGFYETYSREGRNDEIVMFPISDLFTLKYKILK